MSTSDHKSESLSGSPEEYHADREYLSMLREILAEGNTRGDRTGTGTISKFNVTRRYDLTAGFPLLTTKRVFPRGVFGELVFFLRGETSNQRLTEQGIHIWDEWAPEDGDLGPIYGYQWRHFGADYVTQADRDAGVVPNGGVDQVVQLLNDLKNNPFSRRHIISAWNPSQIDEMALPPCHTLFQFYVTPDAEGNPHGLSSTLYQRSMDSAIGAPFNIASYAAMTQLFAELVGLVPLEFVHTAGDAHIYLNHLEQVKEQLSREKDLRPMPTLRIEHPVALADVDLSDPRLFDGYTAESFVVEGYNPHPSIKMPIAV